MNEKAFLIWNSACETHPGKVRNVNQDAYLDLPELGIWAVADGMGGHEAGEIASRTIVDELRLVNEPRDIHSFANEIKTRLQTANDKLRQLANQQYKNNTIGSTIVVLAAFGQQCAFLWVGDSRVYRMRNGVFEQITKDHSMIEDYIDQGLLTPEQAATSSIANVLTRAVGAEDDLEVDCRIDTMHDSDVYLLCSDGLYREVSDEKIMYSMSIADCDNSAKHLLNLALEGGAKDNITVSVVRIKTAAF